MGIAREGASLAIMIHASIQPPSLLVRCCGRSAIEPELRSQVARCSLSSDLIVCRYWRVHECEGSSALNGRALLPVKATLIVCPVHILDQWASEITRHTHPGAVRVRTYGGMKKGAPGSGGASRGSSAHAALSVEEIAGADIVLTTYDALRGDVYHDGTEGRLLRHGRVQVEVSPLLQVTWWRVCLDEAQMVESATAKAAEMALKLSTCNRWCVTGTPGMDEMLSPYLSLSLYLL